MKNVIFQDYNCHKYPVFEHIKDYNESLDNAVPILKENFGNKRIHLVFRGSSGACISTLLQVKAIDNLNIIGASLSRKEGENHHGNNSLRINFNEVDNILIVDDFVDTGSTLEKIIADIESAYNLKFQIYGEDLGKLPSISFLTFDYFPKSYINRYKENYPEIDFNYNFTTE